MRKTIKTNCFVVIFALTAGILLAQSLDFSGEWELNISKSEAPPSWSIPAMTLHIRQEGVLLTVEKKIRGAVTVRRYTTDGREFLNAGSSLKDLKGTARLDSGRIYIRTEEEVMTVTYSPAFPDGTNEYSRTIIEEEYSLSVDGRMLKVTQFLGIREEGSESMKLVFEKVGGVPDFNQHLLSVRFPMALERGGVWAYTRKKIAWENLFEGVSP